MSMYLYKIIHLSGVFMVFLSFGGLIVKRQMADSAGTWKTLTGLTNGVGLLLVLVGGLGLLVKLQLGFPGWALAKFVIWLIFAGLISLANRVPKAGKSLWWGLILLGILAVYLCGMKPF